jgi:hypothetical protein
MTFCEILVCIPSPFRQLHTTESRLIHVSNCVAQHELETASMMDCYSPYGQSATDMELSGGYKEGDGDDLPILRVNPRPLKKIYKPTKGEILILKNPGLQHFDFEKRPEDQRYSESQLHSEYPDSAFRD